MGRFSALKYAIVIPDGAADEGLAELGGRTPLAAARTPGMDGLARDGELGRSRNVPDRFLPASDVATLSLFGYDPEVCYTGRAPLEAAARGIALGAGDWAVRCNLMTIEDGRLTDFTAGHVSSAEGARLMADLGSALGDEGIEFVAGVSYRNLLILRGGDRLGDDLTTTPPHDVPDQLAADHHPRGTGSAFLLDLMRRGAEILRDHEVNRARSAAGKRPANAIWLWGQGRAPTLESFERARGLRGALVTAVDLVRGVGALAGWERIEVPTATGYLDTDYAGKGRAAIAALERFDIVCVHVEAPDEASHEGRADAKVEAIERIDAEIVVPLRAALEARGPYRMLVSPDHSTLIRTRAHDRAPVPWAMAGSGIAGCGLPYDEVSASGAGRPFLARGHELMDRFLA